MKMMDKQSLEEIAFRKAKIAAGCELYLKMAANTGRLPNNCWSKIMKDLGSPQWMKRHHVYNEIKRKRQGTVSYVKPRRRRPPSYIETSVEHHELEHRKPPSIITRSNDDVSEASTLDDIVKTVIIVNHEDPSVVSQLTECGPEERPRSTGAKVQVGSKENLKTVQKKLYDSPLKPKAKDTAKNLKISI
jgi:hypothetical protein